MASIRIEHAEGKDAIAEFVALHDRVYASRAVRWQSSRLHVPMLRGMTPATVDRELRPLVAREGGEVVARVCAVVDGPYLKHWNERIGHLLMFEAQPSAREAVRQLLDAACAWLGERGMEAARIGFGLLETPFTTDDYEALPPSTLRQNPREYHVLIKGAGFETERGFVDYAMPATPQLAAALAELALERPARGLRARAVPRRRSRAARADAVRALERDVREPLGLVPALARARGPVRARRAARARDLDVRARRRRAGRLLLRAARRRRPRGLRARA